MNVVMPHTYLYNGEALCWCGADHADPDGLIGAAKVEAARVRDSTPGYWLPATEAHLDDLYLEAWLEA